jgi:hypothetical protein
MKNTFSNQRTSHGFRYKFIARVAPAKGAEAEESDLSLRCSAISALKLLVGFGSPQIQAF